jgi:pilus assembly protein CpaB
VAGFLYPGSHLDVVATRTSSVDAQPAAQTVLQDVEVLSTGTATEPDPQGKPQTVAVVTLLLSPEDSQKLLLASAQSTIQFVLRSGVDQQKRDIPPTRMDQLFGDRPAAPPTETVAKAPAPRPTVPKPEPARIETPPPPVVEAPKPPEPHVIEMIQGTQRTNQKF